MNQISLCLESIILLFLVSKIEADWGSSDSSQYHIQTDEGPERFFRYQTDNGQFRNEKRLKDGTVIGTDAWIDAAGYLWQKDYIADKEGFRILKNKKIFVGQSRPIKDLVSNGRINTKLLESTTPATPIAVIPTSLNRPIANAIDNDFDYPKRKYPSVLVHYNAEPLDESYTGKPFNGPVSTSTPPPITTYKPVYSSTTTVLPLTSTPSFGISSTTTPTPYYQSPTISPPSKYFLPPSFNQGEDSPIIRIKPYKAYSTPYSTYVNDRVSSELQPPILPSIAFNDASSRNNIAIGISSTPPTPIAATTVLPLASTPFSSKSVIPLGVSKRPIAYYGPNQLAHDYNDLDRRPIDRAYMARTPNGFSYFLPKQYHEETSNRVGSYGYVDPFGIRRVFYYRIGPNGHLELRKKYRYVGLNGKPYES